QDAGHARFNISTKNKTESAQEFGRYLTRLSLSTNGSDSRILLMPSHSRKPPREVRNALTFE
ncbi:hypothetical protein AAAT92_09275, partial [Bifidobacterium adolescentis]|uniref:hypothetical protein n=1 Tax=Bifidobacterium adolescentis TaxID=1680 RepID=UPI0032BFB72B